MYGLAEIMDPPLERHPYMYELRNVAENIARERLENSERHPVGHSGHETGEPSEVQASFREHADNLGNAEASEVEHTPPHTAHVTTDSPSTDGGTQVGPAFHIPMTQDKTLEDLPSQLYFDWQDSVSLNLTPPGPKASDVPQAVTEVNAFAEVSEIAEEAVKHATHQRAEVDTDPPGKTTNVTS